MAPTQTKFHASIDSALDIPGNAKGALLNYYNRLGQAVVDGTISAEMLEIPHGTAGEFCTTFDSNGNVTSAQWQGGLLGGANTGGGTMSRGVTERTVPHEQSP